MELLSSIGFTGQLKNSVVAVPAKNQLVYLLGGAAVVGDLTDNRVQDFLQGHNDKLSCVGVSASGRYVATGQFTNPGFRPDIVAWDLDSRQQLFRMSMHKTKVEAVAFSPNDLYLVSLGGPEDNSVVVWDNTTGQAICGSPASRTISACVTFTNTRDDVFVTGGEYTLRLWELDMNIRKIRATDFQLGQLKRVFTCIAIDPDDQHLYAGTTSGDIIQVNLTTKLLRSNGPEKKPFSKGVTAIAIRGDDLVVGTGIGTIAILSKQGYRVLRSTELMGEVTSITFTGDKTFIVGTALCHMYTVDYDTLQATLRSSCPVDKVNGLAFAHEYSDLFLSCAASDIRVWNAKTAAELLRITVPGVECLCVAVAKDGKSIISGWNDGKIRAFLPQSGKAKYIINDANLPAVTAIVPLDNNKILSGGADGQVRIWRIGRESQVLEAAVKEQKGAITGLHVREGGLEFLSCSTDGTTILFSMEKYTRLACITSETMFRAALYHPDEAQILTCGTNKKIGYWEAGDGTCIREIEGTKQGAINAIAIANDGNSFISAGSDKLLKVWDYDLGEIIATGSGHSSTITCAKISPDNSYVVSASDVGEIFIWRFPTREQ